MNKKLLLGLAVIFYSLTSSAQILINEIMTNNQTTVVDDEDEYSDWIELYNAGGTSVNLLNYTLSDNADSLRKWIFPSFSLAAGAYKIVWCSGRNKFGTNLHTNFLIDSQGESLYLSDASGNVIDNFPAVILSADQSYGRYPTGNPALYDLISPTFNQSNNSTTPAFGVINQKPVCNISGGFFATPQDIILSHPDPNAEIHFTLDGSDPTINSPIYSAPIHIVSRAGDPTIYSNIRTTYYTVHYLPDWYPPLGQVYKCTVLRARAFRSQYVKGPILTNTYFIDPNISTRYGNMPVISLVSDPKNLFSDSSGIYVPGINYHGGFTGNYLENWSRPANIEIFKPGGLNVVNDNFKVSINGQSSPFGPQKAFNVNASTDYGSSKLEYPLFENTRGSAKYIQKFDKFKIRSWGSDRSQGLFRDAYCNSFFLNTDLDVEAYQPAVVFIDGEYFGLHEIRERNRNSEYYQSHYYIDKENPGVDILDGAGNTIIEGDHVEWDALTTYLTNNPMSIPANYNYIKSKIDVNNYMLNFMSSIYLERGDWPDQNEAKWRKRTSDGKWKWIQFDMDNTVAYYLNPWYDMFTLVLTGARGYGPSDLLNTLLESNEFKDNFLNLFADYMNTQFLPGYAGARVDEMKAQLSPYMSEYVLRWQVNMNWTAQTDSMKWWMNVRPQYCRQHILSHFGLTAMHNVTIDVSDSIKGNVQVNTVFLDRNTARVNQLTYPWTGAYFESIPVPLTAIAKPGYRFVEWLPTHNTNPTIDVNLTADISYTAMFDIDPDYVSHLPPVINEVMSSNLSAIADNYGNYDDWMEIYNPDNDTLDVANYYLTDNLISTTRFKFLSGTDSTKIAPHGFLLVWIDDDAEQGILHTPFKFNSAGDFIALVAPDGETIVDSLSFGTLAHNVSYGRRHDAAPQFIQFTRSTPDSTNWIYTSENVFINELQTMNVADIQDANGDHDQWIELYNPNADTIDVGGWKITSDPGNLSKYTFPYDNDSTKIAPNGFKLLWADNETAEGVLHTNFTLGQSGCVSLIKPTDMLVDSACYSGLQNDESYGRVFDGSSQWRVFTISTPDSNNYDLTSGVTNVVTKNNLSVYPVPVHSGSIYFNNVISFTISDALGKELAVVKNRSDFDMSSFDKGVYLLRTVHGSVIRILKE